MKKVYDERLFGNGMKETIALLRKINKQLVTIHWTLVLILLCAAAFVGKYL